MWCGKGCKCAKGLCSLSLGIALGLTGGLAVLLGSFWAIYHGASPIMMQLQIPVPNIEEALMRSLWVFVKGFIFGFFLALFYNLFACLFALCCRKKEGKCHCCGCSISEKSEPGK